MCLRVLHVIPSLGELRGGPSVVAKSLAEALAARGVSVDIATTDDNGSGRLAVSHHQPIVKNGVTYWYFERQIRFYTISLPLFRWLAKHIGDYDLVHIHALFSFVPSAAAFWAKRRGIPYIVRPLGVLNAWGIRNRRPFLKKVSLRFNERRILLGAAAVHFTSEQERCEAQLLVNGTRGIIIPNPVSIVGSDPKTKSKFPELEGRRIILFLSRLDPIKGVDLLLSAYSKVRNAHPDAILLIAGSGDKEFVSRLHEQSRSLGINNDVMWAGFLEGQEKRRAFDCAYVFVLPSHSESFGVAVAEAMAAGLPVVVSDRVGIHREVASAHAGLVVPCDTDLLAQALRTVLRDNEQRSQMAHNAALLAKQFSPVVVAEGLANLYRDVAPDRNAADFETPSPDLCAIVLTHNEEQNLPACLSSLRLLGCPIVVVDSGSTDRTHDIAKDFGATLLEHPFVSHTQQWMWALEKVPVMSRWVLALDADQAITPDLAIEIRRQVRSSNVDGLYIRRRQVFRGRWIKHGGYYPKYLLKLFRRDRVFLHADEAVDHHFYVRGVCGKLRHDMIEANHKEDDISFWIEKHNRYATLMAQEEHKAWEAKEPGPIPPALFGNPDQRVAWLKRQWARMPMYVRPVLYFTYRYFLRCGFLDGKEGFIFHFLQAFWYRLLVDIKLEELRNAAEQKASVQSDACQILP